jgi:hypothetical protein
MTNMKLPSENGWVEINTDPVTGQTIKLLVGHIRLGRRTVDQTRVNALKEALEKCGSVSINEEVKLVDGAPGLHGAEKVPDVFVFHVTYNADIHTAVMAALKPFDDMWGKD